MSFKTPETPRGHLEITTLDSYRLTIKQRISNFLPGRVQQAGKGAPGDAHPLSAFLLLQPFPVFKTDCLDFLDKEVDFPKRREPYSGGLEIGYRRNEAYLSP
jgi:hypothetical protein